MLIFVKKKRNFNLKRQKFKKHLSQRTFIHDRISPLNLFMAWEIVCLQVNQNMIKDLFSM